MKCQMCGNKEANFHCSTNINGCVTETNLCGECAVKSGYDFNKMTNFRNAKSPLLSLGVRGGFVPVQMIPPGMGLPVQFVVRPQISGHPAQEVCDCCNHSAHTQPESTERSEIDEAMMKRRELYMQMRKAAENEDFEKAAQLRDEIKELEVQGDSNAV